MALPFPRRVPFPLLSLAVLLALSHLSSVGGLFTPVTVTSPFPVRFATFTFDWAGAMWVAGGATASALSSNDVWASHDFGRTWQQPRNSTTPVVTLPGLACSGASRGIQYNGALYLVSACLAGNGYRHGDAGVGSNDYWTYVSRSATLSSWSVLKDGCVGCTNFNVERMAVPFDGVGTLVLVNSGLDNSVYWQSGTGAFQFNLKDTWTAFQVGGTGPAFSLPWVQRTFAATATDAEGLGLVMAGGVGGSGWMNDVWQLTWQSSTDAPQVYQLTAAGGWGPRAGFAMWRVHDWLFLYGGYDGNSSPAPPPGNEWDDCWMSADFGTTWTQYTAAATGIRRDYVNALTLGRRFFIVAGLSSAGVLLSDVSVSFW